MYCETRPCALTDLMLFASSVSLISARLSCRDRNSKELKSLSENVCKQKQHSFPFLFSSFFFFSPVNPFYITITYIYHVLINALSAHMIHINLNMIFYTHVEHSPTKTIYIKYYTPPKKRNKKALQTHTHTQMCVGACTHEHTMTVAETGYWY